MEISRTSISNPIKMRNMHVDKPLKDELPPPVPLISKSFRPCPPALHIGEFPFE